MQCVFEYTQEGMKPKGRHRVVVDDPFNATYPILFLTCVCVPLTLMIMCDLNEFLKVYIEI
jgi:hypothetical protein